MGAGSGARTSNSPVPVNSEHACNIPINFFETSTRLGVYCTQITHAESIPIARCFLYSALQNPCIRPCRQDPPPACQIVRGLLCLGYDHVARRQVTPCSRSGHVFRRSLSDPLLLHPTRTGMSAARTTKGSTSRDSHDVKPRGQPLCRCFSRHSTVHSCPVVLTHSGTIATPPASRHLFEKSVTISGRSLCTTQTKTALLHTHPHATYL